MNVNLTPNITGKNVKIIKGATQADLTNSVNNSKTYRDEAEAFSIVSEAKSVEASYSALNASISSITASDKATIATTKANEANNSSINASASEAVCIAKATIATDNADITIAQAVIATNKATEANTSANTANIQAGIATTKASEASTSASNALTSENNADTSEANALTYRNQAEAFANSINTGDIVHISGTETITGNKTFSGTVSGLTKATVGLSSVDNTSDANKPISTATQTALNTKVDKVTSTDNAVVRFDGTTGQLQNSGVVIDDNNNIHTVGRIIATSPNNSSTGSVTLKDAVNNPDTVYLQATNNAGGVQYAYLKFNADGTLMPSGNIVGNITGNAASATKLATTRTINGVNFDGSANISIGLGTQGVLSSNTTLTDYHKNKLLVCIGSFTISLPNTALNSGDLFIMSNVGTGTISLAINGNAWDLSRASILAGETLIIQSDGSGASSFYRFVSRSKDFASNINTTAGYTCLPNGVIIQWGLIPALSADGSVYVAFPISFPNNTLGIYSNSIAAVPTGNPGASTRIKNDYSRNGFTAIQDTYSDLGSFYLAIGY